MNDEIKEKIKAYYIGNDIDKIINYITNLQQEKYELERDNKHLNGLLDTALNEQDRLQNENETRQQDINNLTYQLAKMKEENERLKEDYNKAMDLVDKGVENSYKLLKDYKSRCEKAISKIKDLYSYADNEEYVDNYCKDLLNILQNGSDSQ